MKYLRKFESVSEMNTALASSTIGVIGLAYEGSTPVLKNKPPTPPSNLVISCSNNTVTISATNATTLEYNTDGSSTYITYTEPFEISQTVTVYAKATNVGGSITASQVCEYIKPIDYTIPFYIEDISGNANTIQIKNDRSSGPNLTIEGSTDGETWETMGSTYTTATATVPANGKLYLRCSATTWGSAYDYNYFKSASGDFNVGGNINSLLYGDSFNGQTEFPSGVGTYTFTKLFSGNTRIRSAEQLLLPATTLANQCYYSMFYNCTALTTAPAILPANTLANQCYYRMFSSCILLTNAPALPATTLAQGCYQYMFQGCRALTAAPAILPATTLAQGCYQEMFNSCRALATAPALPATTLVQNCYNSMFNSCINLNYIKCLATDISASNCTTDWVNNVAASGTFVKNPNMSSWATGTSGIPSGWVVKNLSNIELSQVLNVATIEVTDLDSGTGYYTINGGSQVSLAEGRTTIPITQAMNGQTLLAHGEFGGTVMEKTLVFEYVNPYTIPFYIENLSGSDNAIQIKKAGSTAPTLTIEKSTDGNTWASMGTTSYTQLSATVPANGRLYLRCSATQWSTSGSNYNYFILPSSSGDFNVGGNINSLLYGDSFNGQTEFPSGVGTNTFSRLFDYSSNTRIKSAEQLLLPATTLANWCYLYMFKNCTSLTTAPMLPATTLTEGCYYGMFNGCTSLNYIKCLATNISASDCTTSWTNGVDSTGTFVKNTNMSNWTTGTSGIPSGWTVQDA